MIARQVVLVGGLAVFAVLLGPGGLEAAPDTTAVRPVITGVSPERVTAGDTVVLWVAGMPLEPWRVRVSVDGEEVARQSFRIESAGEIHLTVGTRSSGGTRAGRGEWERKVVVHVGAIASTPASFTQIDWGVVGQPRVFIPVIVYLVLVSGTLWLLGGGTFQSTTGNLSLSKLQLGVWTLVFSFSYVLLAAVWRDFIPLTPGMLWLLGISSAMAVGAKAIAVKNDPKPLPRNRASRVCSEFHPLMGGYRCEIHRCQVLLWAIIVLVVYGLKLVGTMHLPDIPDVLLVLSGVSGGTYLGFKYPRTVVPSTVRSSLPSTGTADPSSRSSRRRRRPRRPGSENGGQRS